MSLNKQKKPPVKPVQQAVESEVQTEINSRIYQVNRELWNSGPVDQEFESVNSSAPGRIQVHALPRTDLTQGPINSVGSCAGQRNDLGAGRVEVSERRTSSRNSETKCQNRLIPPIRGDLAERSSTVDADVHCQKQGTAGQNSTNGTVWNPESISTHAAYLAALVHA